MIPSELEDYALVIDKKRWLDHDWFAVYTRNHANEQDVKWYPNFLLVPYDTLEKTNVPYTHDHPMLDQNSILPDVSRLDVFETPEYGEHEEIGLSPEAFVDEDKDVRFRGIPITDFEPEENELVSPPVIYRDGVKQQIYLAMAVTAAIIFVGVLD